jgi:hypothetical protein
MCEIEGRTTVDLARRLKGANVYSQLLVTTTVMPLDTAGSRCARDAYMHVRGKPRVGHADAEDIVRLV